MNTFFRTLLILSMFTAGASAHEPKGCQSSLSIADVAAALGAKVRMQPVFSDGGLKGWRIYNAQTSAHLTAQEIGQGSLMTHVCGVSAREVFANGGNICCNVDTSREVEVTFLLAGQERKFLIRL